MKLVKEYINFERGLDPKDAMNIGLGPKQYIDVFEKTINLIPNIKYEKQVKEARGFICWIIYNTQTNENILKIYLLEPSSDDHLIGWVCKDIDSKNHKNPFFILDYLKNIH
ncbi:MAG: hypothetical protein WC554_13260 [Clostridia bacterium]|jgi:hypothetical protein